LLRLLLLLAGAAGTARPKRARLLFLGLTATSAVVLLGWIVYLGGTLFPPPSTHTTIIIELSDA